jgi:hypothetical protein
MLLPTFGFWMATSLRTQRMAVQLTFLQMWGGRSKASTPAFEFFFSYTLDKAVCPFLATIFEMTIWHPTNKAEVDTLLEAHGNMYVSQLCLSCSSLAVAAP